VKEISMASIIAKVSRDRIMNALPKRYQKYGFIQHKGYGTKLHKEKIAQY
jgi:ribonuclease HII